MSPGSGRAVSLFERSGEADGASPGAIVAVPASRGRLGGKGTRRGPVTEGGNGASRLAVVTPSEAVVSPVPSCRCRGGRSARASRRRGAERCRRLGIGKRITSRGGIDRQRHRNLGLPHRRGRRSAAREHGWLAPNPYARAKIGSESEGSEKRASGGESRERQGGGHNRKGDQQRGESEKAKLFPRNNKFIEARDIARVSHKSSYSADYEIRRIEGRLFL